MENIYYHEFNSIHINEDDPEDDVALQFQEWEGENNCDIGESQVMSYMLEGELRVWRDHCLVFLDGEFIDNRAQWEVENSLEHYEYWKEEHGNGEVRESFRKMKQNLLELVEENLELKRINEGKYLEICNKLKNLSVQEAESIVEDLKEAQANMVHYYKKDSVEPQLVEIYS